MCIHRASAGVATVRSRTGRTAASEGASRGTSTPEPWVQAVQRLSLPFCVRSWCVKVLAHFWVALARSALLLKGTTFNVVTVVLFSVTFLPFLAGWFKHHLTQNEVPLEVVTGLPAEADTCFFLEGENELDVQSTGKFGFSFYLCLWNL